MHRSGETRNGGFLVPAVALIAPSVAVGVGWAASSARLGLIVFAASMSVLAPIWSPTVLGKLRVLRANTRWWHVLWLGLFASGLTLRVRDVSSASENPLDSAALYRVGLVAIVACLLVFFVLASGRLPTKAFRSWVVPLLLAFVALGVASAVWSVFPAWSAYKSLEYLVDLMLIGIIIDRTTSTREIKALVDWTYLALFALAASVLLGVLLYPSRALLSTAGGFGFQVQGVLPAVASNGVGDLGAVLATAACARLLTRSRGFYYFVMLFGFALLLLAQSRTPIAAFLVALAAMLLTLRKFSTLVAIALVMGIAVVSSLGGPIVDFMIRGQSQEFLFSLSGRVTTFWVPAWQVISEHPFFGVGAYSGGRFVVVAQSNNAKALATASGVDNTFVEIALGSGILGLAIMVMAVLAVWWTLVRAVRRADRRSPEFALALEMIGLLSVESFRSFFSSGPFIWHPATRFFLVVIVALYLRGRQNERSASTPGGPWIR